MSYLVLSIPIMWLFTMAIVYKLGRKNRDCFAATILGLLITGIELPIFLVAKKADQQLQEQEKVNSVREKKLEMRW